ncbi:MAG TPA: hypothetical protein VJ798_04915, partial [Rhizomicrobium sp.]|nr:hypothetical protein [Rhizomicrobium sp.]
MGQGIGAVAKPVAGIDQTAILFLFETQPVHVVEDHDFWDVSRYIQGNARPMGTIQSVPARA